MTRVHTTRRAILPQASLLLGAILGLAVATAAGTALGQLPDAVATHPSLEVVHLPPLLTAEGEGELRYDAFCVGDGDPERLCELDAAVYVRVGTRGAFQRLAVGRDANASEGRYVAELPPAIGRSPLGFSYYAVFSSEVLADPVVLPAAGALAPQRSLPLGRSGVVDLGAHVFGRPSQADERVVAAAWGDGPGEVGLEEGRNLSPSGGSSFDVGSDGTVYVLDEANRRLLRWSRSDRTPSHVPVRVNGTLADLAVADDGTAYVLETTPGPEGHPVLRAFGRDGSSRGTTDVAERAAQIRIGPEDQPVVLQHPSEQWMAAAARGRLLDAREQQETGRSGRPLRAGGEVLALRHGNELRLAVEGGAGARRSWRVTSATPLAEVQLAEVFGGRLVAVVRVYSETSAEFLVLVLGERGLEQKIALEAADWAEAAPLSRFRLIGSSLYRLGSTPAGLFVDRVDLEVQR